MLYVSFLASDSSCGHSCTLEYTFTIVNVYDGIKISEPVGLAYITRNLVGDATPHNACLVWQTYTEPQPMPACGFAKLPI